MVRWRFCLVLAVLLLLPSISKLQDADDDESNNEPNDSDNEDDEDNEDEGERDEDIRRRVPGILQQTTRTIAITRTTKKRPLECYVCAYKSDTPLKACLDPSKYRVQTITCHNVDDKCATTVISKGGGSFEAVVRSCKSSCIGTPETTCCDMNRCNNQAYALPTVAAPEALAQESNKTSKSIHHSVLFFVTILLVLQTVVKVTFV